MQKKIQTRNYFTVGKLATKLGIVLRGRQTKQGIRRKITKDTLMMKMKTIVMNFDYLQLIVLFQRLMKMRMTYCMSIWVHPHI